MYDLADKAVKLQILLSILDEKMCKNFLGFVLYSIWYIVNVQKNESL